MQPLRLLFLYAAKCTQFNHIQVSVEGAAMSCIRRLYGKNRIWNQEQEQSPETAEKNMGSF